MVVRRGGQFLMSEVPLFLFMRGVLQDGDRDLGGKLASAAGSASVLQGYLAQKKTPPPRTLQQPYAYKVLWWCFGALYSTHIVAPRTLNSYGVIRDKLRMVFWCVGALY